MSESRGGPAGARDSTDDRFRPLSDRPTPELDSRRLWLRIETRLTPRTATAHGAAIAGGWRPAARLAWGLGALAAVALAVWWGFPWGSPASGTQIVLLTPAPTGAGAAPPDGAAGGLPAETPPDAGMVVAESDRLDLDVRLVRGYDGAPPGDIGSAAELGVGGADALSDVRASIEALLPFESFGLVGVGRAALDDGAALEIVLSDDYRLLTRSVETGARLDEAVRLEGIELTGRGQDSIPADLVLEPGKLYIFGVLAAAVEAPELVLLIRAQARRGGR